MLLHSSSLAFTIGKRGKRGKKKFAGNRSTVNSDENIVKKVLEEILVAVVEGKTQAALNNQEENVISTASDVLPVAPVASSSDINYPTTSYKRLANHLSLNSNSVIETELNTISYTKLANYLSLNSNSVIETELNTRGLMKEHESKCSDNQIMDMQILSDASTSLSCPECHHVNIKLFEGRKYGLA